ncbi:unnamed protein product [Mycena citricolor]|uniref:Uncharacterized protein n=1 Tax=Mycena citricolor TaxID=2018698 RepID=A0AAD2JW78_9AGAR|nr:unnamed protein product [Mycena citricolor]
MQRSSRTHSPPTSTTHATTTPLRSTRSGLFNNNTQSAFTTTYTPTVTQGSQAQKPIVVTRVAIEGKANQGEDGAGIRMYLKIALPLDGITPGSTIPLFPEENVKILSSQVHPLDSKSVPYAFSSDLSPLLHHAARALSLPSRSSENFHAVFNLSPPPSESNIANSIRPGSSRSGSSSKTAPPPVEAKYTGHILVSGYHISYVLPKSFPGRYHDADLMRTPGGGRRSSIIERPSAQFMAAIDMWVPYVSKPPRFPYLLSIPTPRCLHNHVRLRIPPIPSSNSFASLSSADEDGGGSWDLTSEPHVTRAGSSRQSRSDAYSKSFGNVADDESSDSSTTGFSDGCGIQGTFPSAERLRVRWARPVKVVGSEHDGRRRVGVTDVTGEMTCAVQGRMWDPEHHREAVVMKIEYKGTCKGLWFPGVATLLGMDVSLEAKGSDVSWVPGKATEWNISGAAGYTGFDAGGPSAMPDLLRKDSFDSTSSQVQLDAALSRQSSSSSLLRGPLPAQNELDYSFEHSQTLSADSSAGSLFPTSSVPPADPGPRPPGVPITIHIDMNKLTAVPIKANSFAFQIQGTVLISARARGQRDEDLNDPNSMLIPRFTVLAADHETVSTIIRHDTDAQPASTVNVLQSNGRKHHIQRGDYFKCRDSEQTRILVSPSAVVFPEPAVNGKAHPPSRPRTPNGSRDRDRVPSTAARVLGMVPARPKREGKLMIPSVVADVTPLVTSSEPLPTCYAVRVTLAAPADTDSDWVEFGLAKHGADAGGPPKIEIVNATVDDVPIFYETSMTMHQDEKGLVFEQMSGLEWVSWIRLRVGSANTGRVVVDYIVKGDRKGKGKSLDVHLPSFGLPVGRLEVNIENIEGTKISSLRSNFAHEQPGRLLHYSLEPFFYPHISFDVRPERRARSNLHYYSLGQFLLFLIPWLLVSFGYLRLEMALAEVARPAEDTPLATETVTITSTAYQTLSSRKPWFQTEGMISELTASTTKTTTTTSELPSLSTSSETTFVTVTPSALPTRQAQPPPFDSGVTVYRPFHVDFALWLQSWDTQTQLENLWRKTQEWMRLFWTAYHYPVGP